MRVITFSRYFPVNHPRKGVNTFFPEKILCSLGIKIDEVQAFKPYMNDFAMLDGSKKVHTIRAGNRWKVGDWFSPRIWTGKPYQSKQLQFGPLIEIKKIWNFELRIEPDGGDDIQLLYINNREYLWYDGGYNDDTLKRLCRNDGLSENEFMDWFLIHPKLKDTGFVGQILCWNEKIEY